jgi:nucleotide-binding universal stress UspA family protein
MGAALRLVYLTRSLPDLETLAGLHVKQHVDREEPVEIIALAEEPASVLLGFAEQPDVLLVPYTGKINAEYELGPVAEEVVRKASSPILLVRPEAPSNGYRIRRLLVPLDGSPVTAAALPPISRLACQLGASIDLLYVASSLSRWPDDVGTLVPPRYVDQPHHEWRAWFAEMIARYATVAECPANVSIEVFLQASEDVAEDIAHFAKEHSSDAIVLVRRSHLEDGHAGILRGVLKRTPCPVFIVGVPET